MRASLICLVALLLVPAASRAAPCDGSELICIDLSSRAEVEASGYGLAVRRAELRYRAPAVYDQQLLIRTRVARRRVERYTLC